MEQLLGEWELERHENFNEVLKELGRNVVERQFALRLTTYADIKEVGDGFYALKTVTGPVKKQRKMRLEEEFEDDAPTGGKMVGCWKIIDGRMVGTFQFKEIDKQMRIERYIEDDKLIEIMTVGSETCMRYFKRRC